LPTLPGSTQLKSRILPHLLILPPNDVPSPLKEVSIRFGMGLMPGIFHLEHPMEITFLLFGGLPETDQQADLSLESSTPTFSRDGSFLFQWQIL
jgi:hypothetical protein